MPNSQPKPIDDPSVLFTSEIDQSMASASALYEIKVYTIILSIKIQKNNFYYYNYISSPELIVLIYELYWWDIYSTLEGCLGSSSYKSIKLCIPILRDLLYASLFLDDESANKIGKLLYNIIIKILKSEWKNKNNIDDDEDEEESENRFDLNEVKKNLRMNGLDILKNISENGEKSSIELEIGGINELVEYIKDKITTLVSVYILYYNYIEYIS